MFLRLLISILLGSLPAAHATELSFAITPRLDLMGDRNEGRYESEATRGHLGVNSSLKLGKSGDFQAYIEGFGEYDLSKNQANLRREQSDVILQEAYLEYKWGPVLFRAGKQPVRWSDSWTLPSLDIWSARYYNRLFFDPVSEQLVHPTGVLMTVGSPHESFTVFENLVPAQNQYPEPFPSSTPTFTPQLGLRGKVRLDSGFDLSAIFANQSSLVTYGASVSYALEQAVPKLEIGKNNAQSDFATVGSDIFIDDFTLLPQFTYYKVSNVAPFVEEAGYSWLAYGMVRWNKDPHEFDVQGFYDAREKGQFVAVHYSYQFRSGPLLELFAQNYAGNSGTLLGLYQQLTHSDVVGAKFGITF